MAERAALKKTSGSQAVRALVVGAHPDDPEVMAGGLAALWTDAGAVVKFISMTNGDAGHHEMGGGPLARRRYAEAQAAARVLGISYDVVDRHDGELEPTLANRRDLICRIREFRPDIVLTHPPDDYHPDHRYTSQLVQDAAMSVTVPNICALTPSLRRNPVFAYVMGTAGVSQRFTPELFVDIGPVVERKLDLLACHVSQFAEWIPWLSGRLSEMPRRPAERDAWIREGWRTRLRGLAQRFREPIVRQYGAVRGRRIEYAEAVEICAYGAPLTDAARARIFPFVG